MKESEGKIIPGKLLRGAAIGTIAFGTVIGAMQIFKQQDNPTFILQQSQTFGHNLLVSSEGETVVIPEDFNLYGLEGLLPEISKNGRVAFVGKDLTGNSDFTLYATESLFSKKIKPLISSLDLGYFKWSPDGNEILIIKSDTLDRNLYVVNSINGEISNKLIDSAKEGSSFEIVDWSADGKKIFYTDINSDTHTPEIISINKDGTDRKLILDRDQIEFELDQISLSPKGDLMFVTYLTRDTNQQIVFNIGSLNLNNLNFEKIFNTDPNKKIVGIKDLVVSPDGEKIIFSCQKESMTGICAIDIDGKNLKEVVSSGLNFVGKFRNNETIYIHHVQDTTNPNDLDQSGIYTINLDGSNKKLVVQDDPNGDGLGWEVIK